MPAIVGRISKGKYPSLFGIDGLIDGVIISGKAKDPSEILAAFQISGLTVPDMEPRHWPVMVEEPLHKFGVKYTKLKYYETWDNMWRVSDHPDVVVTFDELPDRASHSSLVWGIPSEPFLMYGLTSKPANELRPLANSWNDPPKIKKLQGATSAGYEQNQRAYLLERQKDRFEFVLQGTESSPIMNPCFIIKKLGSGTGRGSNH